MKAILEFNLPEELEEYNLVNNAFKMHSALWDMEQWLRTQVKYAPDEISPYTYDAFEECINKLNEILTDNNLEL